MDPTARIDADPVVTRGEPIGLIAGGGDLPRLVARGMRRSGRPVHGIGLRGQYEPRLPAACDHFSVAGALQPGRWIRLLHRAGIREAVMVGSVTKRHMHDARRILRELPDRHALDLWFRRLRHDRRNAAVLGAVADLLARHGITLIDSTTSIPEHLASPGVLTPHAPSNAQRADLEFGASLLHRLVELDIGQAIAVRGRDVVAVEALEGTARMIDRAGGLCGRRPWTLLKTAASEHDRRADVPVVGVETIEQLHAAGGRCLGIGAGRVILLDRPRVLRAAAARGIVVVGFDAS